MGIKLFILVAVLYVVSLVVMLYVDAAPVLVDSYRRKRWGIFAQVVVVCTITLGLFILFCIHVVSDFI